MTTARRFAALGVVHLAFVALVLASAAGQAQITTSAVVPYYGATYGTPGGFSAADARRVVELLESHDRRLEAIEANTAAGGKAPAAKKGPDLAAAAGRHCASCHKPGTADGKGGGFVLFADDTAKLLRPLGTRERQRVRESVLSGDMPPGKKLTPDQKAAFE